MDLTELTNDQLAEHIRAGLLEAEARIAANGSYPRVLKRVKLAHAHLEDALDDLVGGGEVSPMSGGEPKV